MDPGRMDQRITVTRRNVTGQTAQGEDVLGTASVVGIYWAAIEFVPAGAGQGPEPRMVEQRLGRTGYSITIRRQADEPRRADSITWGSKTLDILDVEGPGTRLPFWILTAKDSEVA